MGKNIYVLRIKRGSKLCSVVREEGSEGEVLKSGIGIHDALDFVRNHAMDLNIQAWVVEIERDHDGPMTSVTH